MAELRICLDPGHGQYKNRGYVNGFYEGTNNYQLATYLKEELEKYQDIKVFVTRKSVDEGNKYDGPSLDERGQFAIDNKCEVMISLHSNAYDSTAACGVSCFRSVLRPDSEKFILKLANAVVDLMNKTTGITYLRGGKPSIRRLEDDSKSKYYNQDWYGILRNSVKRDGSSCVKYAAIIEHGFHTNPKECEFINSQSNLKLIAQTEAKVIADYFGKKLKTVQESVKPIVSFEKGDLVKIVGTKYYSGKTVPAWAKKENWFVKSAPKGSDRIVLGENEKHNNTLESPFHSADLQLVKSASSFTEIKTGDLVKIVGTKYYSGKTIPKWVLQENWFVKSAPTGSDRIVLGQNEKRNNSVDTAFNRKDLEKIK